MLNHKVFQDIQTSQKHILAVTKYWDRETTIQILTEVQTKYPDILYGI
jgi:hypothetical protein